MMGTGPSTTTLTAAMDAAAEEVEGMEYRAALRGSYRGEDVREERKRLEERDGGGKALAYFRGGEGHSGCVIAITAGYSPLQISGVDHVRTPSVLPLPWPI